MVLLKSILVYEIKYQILNYDKHDFNLNDDINLSYIYDYRIVNIFHMYFKFRQLFLVHTTKL